MGGEIRTGIGGWTFEPWRGVFYPKGLRQADELAYAASKLTAIEINGTYYSTQSPESFAKWAASTPEGFKFTVKASRFATNRKVLSDAAAVKSIQVFMNQGIVELGSRLGPIIWQFMPFKKFEPDDFAAFLDILPRQLGPLEVRHCVEVRNASFATPEFVELCRDKQVAICLADHQKHPLIADATAPFVYMRLQQGDDDIEAAYPDEGLDLWASRIKAYARGETPADLPQLAPPASVAPREVYVFVIHEGKVRAPAGAMALKARADA